MEPRDTVRVTLHVAGRETKIVHAATLGELRRVTGRGSNLFQLESVRQ